MFGLSKTSWGCLKCYMQPARQVFGVLGFLVGVQALMGCQLIGNSTGTKKLVIKKHWVRNTLSKERFGYRHLHRASTVFYEDLVIQANSIDGIVAYHRSSGQLKWRRNIKGGIEDGLALSDGALFVAGNDGYFYSLKAYNGVEDWTFPIRFEGVGQPTVYKDVVLFQAGNNVVYALDKNSGLQKWLYSRKVLNNISIHGVGRPYVSGSKVYVGFSDGFLVSLNLENGQAMFERQFNYNKRFKDIDGQLIVDGTTLYLSSYDDKLVALDKDTGKNLWEVKLPVNTSPLVADNKIYVGTTDSRVVCLDRDSGKQLWTYRKVGHGVSTRPTLYKGLLVFGYSKGHLTLVNAQSGKLVTTYSTGRGVSSMPTIDEKTGEMFFMSVDANLHSTLIKRVSSLETWPWEI